ncbi:MAG: CSLREA domain-containing protein [Planctomycetes bacterium]|nr:CSLREA domain-containing protein [Planctomycetota bacterium]
MIPSRRRRRKSPRSRRNHPRIRRLHFEPLEDRLLLTTLAWENEGSQQDGDEFEVYGSNANLARAIVNRALDMWEQVLPTIHPALGDPESFLSIEIEAADLGACSRGSTDFDVGDGFTIVLDDDAAGCPGPNSFWYFDPNWGDSVEFPTIVDADIAIGGPAGFDFLSTVVHELGHVFGIRPQYVGVDHWPNLDFPPEDFPVGTDQVDLQSSLFLAVKNNVPLITLTQAGGMHIYEGPSDPNLPLSPVLGNDLMNSGRTTSSGMRRLISDFDVELLKKGYGYLITDPTELANFSFYAQLDTSSGQPSSGLLTVTGLQCDPVNPCISHPITGGPYGESANSRNEDIIVDATDNTLSTIGVFVTGPFIPFSSSAISSISINTYIAIGGADDGDDKITLDFSDGNWIPSGGITIDGGSGTNTLEIKGPPGTNLTYTFTGSQMSISGGGGSINYTNISDMTLTMHPSSSNNTIVVSGTGGLQTLVLEGSDDIDTITVNNTGTALQALTINSLGGPDPITIEGLGANTALSIGAGNGNNVIQFTPTGGNLSVLPAVPMSIIGTGSDLLILQDFNAPTGAIYGFDVGFITNGIIVHNAAELFVIDSIAQVVVNAGSGNDVFFILGTPFFSDLEIFANGGDDEFIVHSSGPSPTVDNVHSHVTVHGGSGTNTAELDDRGDATGDTFRVTDTTVSDGPANTNTFFGLQGSFEYHELGDLTPLADLTIHTGRGRDTINVESTAKETDTSIFAGVGNDIITVAAPPDPNAKKGKGKGRREGTVDEIKSLLTIDGELGADTLTVIDNLDTTSDKMTLTETTIGMGMGPPNDNFLGSTSAGIIYHSIAELTVLMGSGGNMAIIESTHPGTNKVFVKTGEGNDTLEVQNAAGTVNDIHSKLDIDGQEGTNDIATVDDSAEVAVSTLTVTAAQVLGIFGTGGELSYTGWEMLNVNAGLAGDTVFVTGTQPLTETNVNTGGGIDLITVASAGQVKFVRSPLEIDGGGGPNNALSIINSSDSISDQVTITVTQVLNTVAGTFFATHGSLTYSNLTQLNLVTSTANDSMNIQSTNPGTQYLIGGGGGNDFFLIDSNGPVLGGHVDSIASQVTLVGGLGTNVATFNDTSDPGGDVVTVTATGPLSGQVGAGPSDSFFGGGTVLYQGINGVFLATSDLAADVVNLTPAQGSPATVFVINGQSPTFADPPPGDRLNLNLAGVTFPKLTVDGFASGDLTSGSHGLVSYQNIELVAESSGGVRFDLVVDMNAAALGGNDSAADAIEAFRGIVGTQKTLNLQVNGQLAFTAVESAINSLHVIGSGDDDTFLVVETAEGLPTLPGDLAPPPVTDPGHTNSDFLGKGLMPQNISIHFDGGPGNDKLDGILISPQDAYKFDDSGMIPGVTPNSGVIHVFGAFSMSYEDITPVRFQGAGGTLTVSATLLTGMTEMTLLDLGGGVFEISGDGGFETTTFSGFDAFFVRLPDGVPLRIGDRDRTACTVTRSNVTRSLLQVLGDDSDNQIEIVDMAQDQVSVACGGLPPVLFDRTAQIMVDTAGGDDQVMIKLFPPDPAMRIPASPLTVSFDIFAGAGGDKVMVNHSAGSWFDVLFNVDMDDVASQGEFNVFDAVLTNPPEPAMPGPAGVRSLAFNIMGHGSEERVTFQNLADSSFFDISFAADLGGGFDFVDVLFAQAAAADGSPAAGGYVDHFHIDGGADDDILRFDYRRPLTNELMVELRGGAGHDLIDAVVDALGGSGELFVQVLGDVCDHVGAICDDDDLRLDVFNGDALAALSALIDGGPGFNTLSFTPFSPSDQYQIINIQQQIVSLLVNTADDLDDGVCDLAHCSLREAINTTNALPGFNIIRFRIPGLGPHTILPAVSSPVPLPAGCATAVLDAIPGIDIPNSAFPTITDPVFIDGYSQPGSIPNTMSIDFGTSAQLMIELNGSLITDGSSGLVFVTTTAVGSRARGLAVNHFGYPDVGAPGSPPYLPMGGIALLCGGANMIEGSFVGVDPDGVTANGNLWYGIYISSSHNLIGGPHPWQRNLISGNQGFGLMLNAVDRPISSLHAPTEFNRVQGNLIGTDRTGTLALPNTGAGVIIEDFARHNLIGGVHAAGFEVRNIIAGNGGPFSPFGDPTGPYQDWPDSPYPLSGGHGSGIHVENLSVFAPTEPVPNTIQGNYIGTNADGTAVLPNLHRGITLVFTNSVTIGGDRGTLASCLGPCNLISGNADNGIVLTNFLHTASDHVVQGNFIGTDRTGTLPIGNVADGVFLIHAAGNLIGGGTPGQGNLIAHNRTGVLVRGHPLWPNPAGNTIRLNSIHSNALLGVDLVASQTGFGDGPTGNDLGDADDGPNGLQNFPLITFAQAGASTVVSGTLNSLPDTFFVLDFYASAAADPTGFGEGQRWLGSVVVMTNALGDTSFNLVALSGSSAVGEWITATATRLEGSAIFTDTSEFSAAISAVSPFGAPRSAATSAGVFPFPGRGETARGDERDFALIAVLAEAQPAVGIRGSIADTGDDYLAPIVVSGFQQTELADTLFERSEEPVARSSGRSDELRKQTDEQLFDGFDWLLEAAVLKQ